MVVGCWVLGERARGRVGEEAMLADGGEADAEQACF